MPREKSRYRDKRSSSYSSESSYDRKKSKSSKHKRRSRSRDRSESSSQRRKRSTSRSKYKRRSYSRSVSRERYESKSRKRSLSRSKSKRSRYSRDRSRSRSSSRSRSKYSKSSKKHRRRSRSSSRSNSSFDIDDTETQVEKAIKAAEAAGVTLTKIPTYEYKEVDVKEDMPTIHDRNVLDDINSESFIQQSFTSSRSKKQSQNIVIDLNAETVKIPESGAKTDNNDSIINFDEIPCEAELKEMWVKKLYQFRKKMLKGEIQ